MKLKCILRDIDNQQTIWEDITSLYINRDCSTPADFMEIKGIFKTVGLRFGRVSLYIDDDLIFEGMIDKQRQSSDKNGTYLTLECRSRGAVLLDNQAVPAEYFSVTGPDIFARHIKGYGFELVRPLSSYVIPVFKVTNGISEWDVFEIYCQRIYGGTAFIDNSGRVRVDRNPVYFKLEDAPIIAFYTDYDPCNTISHIYVRDGNGYYTTRIDNDDLQDNSIKRRRYIMPSGQYIGRPDSDAYARIKKSMRQTYSQTAVLAGFHKLDLAGIATFAHPLTNHDMDFVQEITYSMNQNGFTTAVRCVDYRFR